jgi:hypothetical protein
VSNDGRARAPPDAVLELRRRPGSRRGRPGRLAHARALLVHATAQEVTRYVDADYRTPEVILDGAREVLDFDQPIAVLFRGVFGYLDSPGQAATVSARCSTPCWQAATWPCGTPPTPARPSASPPRPRPKWDPLPPAQHRRDLRLVHRPRDDRTLPGPDHPLATRRPRGRPDHPDRARGGVARKPGIR